MSNTKREVEMNTQGDEHKEQKDFTNIGEASFLDVYKTLPVPDIRLFYIDHLWIRAVVRALQEALKEKHDIDVSDEANRRWFDSLKCKIELASKDKKT